MGEQWAESQLGMGSSSPALAGVLNVHEPSSGSKGCICIFVLHMQRAVLHMQK